MSTSNNDHRVNPLFSLRAKLTAMLLFASLTAALAVGGTAYWMLMQDFNASVREHAFKDFQADMQAYLGEYGSWNNARRNEPFHEFAMRRREMSGTYMPQQGGGNISPDGKHPAIPLRDAPFHFLLLDPQGRVLLPTDGYRSGQQVAPEVVREARPISVRGKVEVLAVPLGSPQLSEQDEAYFGIMRKALLRGMLAACVLSVVMGLLLGSRLGARVRELTAAIRSMRPDGELLQQVPVHTRDEMGLLATAFNRMSSELSQAHEALKTTTAQVQQQSEQLRELSIRDALTQLYNRRYFDEQAAQFYQQAIRHDRPLCVMVGDLDHFKSINDKLSHAIGDEVLRRVAALMKQNSRRSDVVARYGGEEFVIAFVESTAEQAAVRCEELRSAIEHYPWHETHPDLRVTMSMGLSDDTSLGNIEKMLAAADVKLYEAKHGGRNRVIV
ncbi:MAG TPA: diguanylate cyclase [Gallionella sp.]|nr:diguanylate cyclase [Gallionella sp.]